MALRRQGAASSPAVAELDTGVATAALLALQRHAGNRAVNKLLIASDREEAGPPSPLRKVPVQRWSLGDTWSAVKETVTSAAKHGWDFLTGGTTSDTSKPKAGVQLVQLEGFDPAQHVEVTDPEALLRRPPPKLTSRGKKHLIPQGSLVHVVDAVQKGSKHYVLVRDVLDTEPMGWTAASNIAGLTLRPKAGGGGIPGVEPTPSETDDGNLSDELTRVDNLEVRFEERTESDQEKIRKVTEKAAPSALLAKQGITPEKWFADLYPGATFLGIPIKGQNAFRGRELGGVHKELYERLKRAEELLMEEVGLDATGTATALGLRTIGGLRPGSGSLHTLGLAVDINADRSNPWLRKSSQEPVRRATQFISKSAVDVLAEPAKQTGSSREQRVKQARQMYRQLTSTATALETYFKFRTSTTATLPDGTSLELADLANAYANATGDRRTAEEWQEQIKADYETLKGHAYGKRREPAKASATMDLDERLVIAMAKVGLVWGGIFGAQGKDIMHFDLRDGTVQGPNPSRTLRTKT